MPLVAGDTIGHYRLEDRLGEGGMGVVWRATDTRLDREVALKLMTGKPADSSESWLRFRHEAKVLASLAHPNIVTIHSIEEAAGCLFLTTELVRGSTLAAMIPPSGFELRSFFKIAVPLADAVAASHGGDVIHGDLKPRNVMIGDNDQVKVLDFGLARTLPRREVSRGEDTTTLTEVGLVQFSGTLPYMSPEQIQGAPLDARSDIFSLGILLYEMATGRRPFTGEHHADLAASILKDDPVPAHELNPQLPRHLSRVLARALEKQADRRFQAVADLRIELELLARDVTSSGSGTPSIAVLPFSDLSSDRDQDYFCEGLADEIINAITRLEHIRVASRTSSFQFRGTPLDSREICDRLGVGHLLEGSVRKSGNRLRITARLVHASDGCQLWSDRFDRELKDVFAIQDEIAERVVEALRIRISPQERRAIKQVSTADVQAYEYYLRGRKFYDAYGRRGIELALQMFERAIELDPDYALAWTGIADCRSFLYLNEGRDEKDRILAEKSSARALELDNELAQAHASHGFALSLSHDDSTEEAFETAIRLNPRLYEAYYYYARYSFAVGRFEKAIELYERASEVRPDDYQVPLLSAQIYDDLGRQAEGDSKRHRGIRLVEERLEFHPDDVRAIYCAANAMVILGDRQRGLEWAERALRIEPEEPMTLYNVACIFALAGERERAVDHLEASLDRGLSHADWILHDSNLDGIRDHPRFAELLERVGELARS